MLHGHDMKINSNSSTWSKLMLIGIDLDNRHIDDIPISSINLPESGKLIFKFGCSFILRETRGQIPVQISTSVRYIHCRNDWQWRAVAFFDQFCFVTQSIKFAVAAFDNRSFFAVKQ